jgi:hypothetical protein
MKICTMTWNAHGEPRVPEKMIDADVLVISLQECYKIPQIKYFFKYTRVCSMFGIKTIILSNNQINVKFYRIGLGIFGFVNKGFIASRINEKIMHINAHLAPHEYNNHIRLAQLEKIVGFIDDKIMTVILTGDLNFRGLSQNQANEFKGKYPEFHEEDIKFKPTYKYKGMELNLNRQPSYCDRIMIASMKKIKVYEYSSLENVALSDHKPVVCVFKILNDKIKDKLFKGGIETLAFRTRLTKMYIFIIEQQNWFIMILFLILLIIKSICL